MELTKIECKTDGTITKETFTSNEENYEILYRQWATSDGAKIREWTVDEYIRTNPNKNIILPFKIDNREINVEAHCQELRQIYAKKDGKKCVSFCKSINYPLKDNKE